MRIRSLRTLFILVLCGVAVPAFAGDTGHAAGSSMPHRMMVLVMQLGAILFAARLGNMCASRLKLPGVVGELLAGILIGPYLLGAVPLHGFPHGLFGAAGGSPGAFPVSPELYGICAVASVVLLFMVGLETDIKLFMRYSVAGTLVGVGGVVVSFVLGDLMAMGFSKMLFGEPRGFFDPSCLFLGIISTATSVGITARILSEQRKLDSPEGVTILAGAVVDDVLGIILLAVGMGVIAASGGTSRIDWGHIAAIAAKAVGVWLLATALGLIAARRISTLLKWFRDRSAIAILALGLAMILAGLFEQAGLAMIIGAYVMGLSLSRTDITHVIREKLHSLQEFLVPVFFTVMGMLVDVRLMASKEVLLFGLFYTVVAAAAKLAGCGLPALFCNFNWRGAVRIGAGMLPRGEVTLIIAGVGLAGGLLNPKIFGVVILMTLVAALAAPPLLVTLFRNPGSGLRRPVACGGGEKLTFSFPSAEAASLLIGKLLVAFDREGFFVHTLSRRQHLYQLRKDEVTIGLKRNAADVVFDCSRAQIPFVNTAMLEVVAELEQTIQELRKPIDVEAIGKRVQDGTATEGRKISLADYLSLRVLAPRLKSETKEEAMEEMLQILARGVKIKDMEEARGALWAREHSMSTGMQYGIAIPHARTDTVDRLVCAVGLKPRGIDFDSMDGRPSRIFVLTLSPKSAATPHVRFMSMVSQLMNKEGRAALLAAETADDMYAVLTGRHLVTPTVHAPSRSLLARFAQPKPQEGGLSQYLRPESIRMELKGTTKEEAIDELLDILDAQDVLRDRDEARTAVFAREDEMSSGIEHGVAVPHARTDAVDRLVCAVGLKKDGIDFGAADNEPSQIFVITLSPHRKSAPHCQFMAMVCRALDADGREHVLAASTADEVWRILVEGSRGG